MASRAHLTRTATTDRNGRTTTVYRNLQGRPAAPGAAAIPAPSATVRRAGRTSVPLPPVAERSHEEMTAFLDRPRKLFDAIGVSHGWLKDTPGGREAVSLAMDLTERGVLDPDDATTVLAVTPHDPEQFRTDVLRVAEQLAPHKAECAGNLWMLEVISVVRGLYDTAKDPREHRLKSEAELASAAAVARFTLRYGYHEDLRRTGQTDLSGKGDVGSWKRVKNPHLERLIARRPEDVERIMDYVDERGVHLSRKKDVDDLCDWLDEDGATAVSDGWL